MTIFVAFGGAVGGFAISIPIVVLSVAVEANHHAQHFLTIPIVVMLAGLFGIGFGLPASAITGAAYAFAGDFRRNRLLILVIGATASAVWGLYLPLFLPGSNSISGATSVLLASAGVVSTLFCLWLIKIWRLETPD